MLISAIKRQKREFYKKSLVHGMEKQKIMIARMMLLQGLDIPFVVQITRLSEETVSKLKADLEKKS